MTLFEAIERRNHEQVVMCSDKESGLKAIIAIHNTTLGPALGGTRFWPYASDEAALKDVLRLSRGMTYKSAAAGLNLGGGKAVIIGDAKKMKSEALFRAYGRFVQGLGGRYITAEDVGTTVRDMEWVRQETDFVTGISRALGGSGDPSPVTALGVFEGIKASMKWVTGNESLAGKTVAVQGVGAVGFHLVVDLVKAGAKVVACDIDKENIKRVNVACDGVEFVGIDEIYDVDCDVYAPCALGGTVNDETVPRLKCSIVAGSANNVLADDTKHAKALAEREILYAPDYVINSGGLINVANELEGYNRERAIQQASGIHDVLTEVYRIASEQSITAHLAANHLAEQRIVAIGGIKRKYVGTNVHKKMRGVI